jgi:hypothetical protein
MSEITSFGTTPEIFSISLQVRAVELSVPLWTNDRHVYKVLMLLLRSPSEISINLSKTSSDSILTPSFLQIMLNLSIWAALLIGENLNFTHLDAKGSIIFEM